MNFYIKNTDTNKFIEEKKYLNDLECKKIKKFILERKHAMGYINEKYDDFVFMIFPARHDIVHFEIHYKLKKAVMGIVVKTEEAYEHISENIDDKDTHLEFLKTPASPAVTVDIQENFKIFYNENKDKIEEMFIKIGTVLLDINF